jgi:myo-inositol 2-dehydrogenase / D-chiro-inositol 1-dehydrogenase
MKVIIVGSGSFAQKHAGILSEIEDVGVVAFCSRTAAHARAAADALAARTGSEVRSYTDLVVALDTEKPDAAAVVVTPDGHGEIELELVRRGIPFLIEKPIGIDRDAPRRIAEAVDSAGLVTSAAFHFRYLDTVATMDAMVRATTPVIANGYWMSTLPPPAWWRHSAESGGQFVEQTVHMIDLLRCLLGEAESVYTVTSQRAIGDLHADADVPDAGAAVIRMKSGMTATIINSCVGPAALRVGLEVVTPVALLQFAPSQLTIRRENETTEKRPGIDPYRAEDAAFINAVRTGDTSEILSPYADALKTHELTMAIVESGRTGSVVPVPG